MTQFRTKYLAGVTLLFTFLVRVQGFAYALPAAESSSNQNLLPEIQSAQSAPPDTGQALRYPYREVPDYPSGTLNDQPGIFLKMPSNIKSTIEYNPETGQYEIKETIGDRSFRPTTTMSLDEYRKYEMQQAIRQYWQQRASGQNLGTQNSFMPKFNVGGEAFDKIFGSNTIKIVPQGSAELIFGFNLSRVDNPRLSEKLRRTPSFMFDEKIQMNVTGSIGEKLQLGVNYNTEATFDFENKTKIGFEGEEDDIIKKVEAGNITMPLTGSLITGSQSLFGLKTEMQFGKLTVTNVFSQQKGETSVIETQGGAQMNKFAITADDYEANRHFFLSHAFRDHYDAALATLPIISSGINITRIEVWITNKSTNLENARNILALTDLGEVDPAIINSYWAIVPGAKNPANESNNEYDNLTKNYQIRSINTITSELGSLQSVGFYQGQDFEKMENARLLTDREYSVNERLGYISLNTPLNADEILAVAYEYTVNGVSYQVGELSTAGVSAPSTLVLKLLKGTNLTPKLRNWDLMMKNVYAMGAYQLSREDFQLNILYQDDKTGNAINYLTGGAVDKQILLKVLNLDNLNSQLDPSPDGVFDFIEGITINSTTGRLIFPVLEPFGSYLKKKIVDPVVAEKYVYQELYDSTQTRARQVAEKNKFRIEGNYQSSSTSEISLNAMNVPQGSVKVTSGGIQLTENVDYTVDYTLGRVKIINSGLMQSGTPIQISLENNSMYSIQTKTLIGAHFNYKISDKFNLGATILNLTERPLTQKVNIGEEPISNTIWGLNGNYSTESRFLTKLIDKLPFLETKEISTISFDGEFAQLIPGSARAIGKQGTAYIDDFEGSETSYELKTPSSWYLASTPRGQPDLFPEGTLIDSLAFGFNRARLAWYTIDPLFTRNNSLTPAHLSFNDQSSHFVREVYEKEIFPNRESPNNLPTTLAVLNLAYYPNEKGFYNYDMDPTPFSQGINDKGELKSPETRWGGIMRDILYYDFESANVEYIEFWLMDPFIEEDSLHTGGDLYFNLGNVSEDVLRDGRKSFENGLPAPNEDPRVDTTAWGLVPSIPSTVNSFDDDDNTRLVQDVGLDGTSDKQEQTFFQTYLDKIKNTYSAASEAYQKAEADPSNDDYHYYRGPDYDQDKVGILDRYKKYNGLEGNSPTSKINPAPYPSSATNLPDVEDVNRDNTLGEEESYYQYKVSIRPEDLVVGKNFITDKIASTVTLANKQNATVNWYQFKVPVHEPEAVIGGIQDFKSIRFMRMFLKDFDSRAILRFAKLELVRGEWRKYDNSLMQGNEGESNTPDDGSFEITAVNIEENSNKSPVNYVLPPGFDRVIDPSSPQLRQLNEQSMALKIHELADGDARAAFKNTDLDIRQYKRLKMEVHAEAIPGYALRDGDFTVFIRLGTDYKNNYYEYEVPLHLTPPRANGKRYDNNSGSDRKIVWPEENSIDIDLDLLMLAKLERDKLVDKTGSNITVLTKFPFPDGDKKIYVCGNPNLSNIKTIMIGIRNPGDAENKYPNDYLPKSGEIWINELRLTNFNDKSGWAANARATAKLADLGAISLAGSKITPGFGSIDKKVNERSKEEINSYDLATNLELGRFFSEKSGIRIPLFLGFSETRINPEYFPLDPDVPFEVALKSARNQAERDSIKNISQDLTRRRSVNFTNVKFGKTSTKPKPWDLGNWTASYSYSENFARNIKTEYNRQKRTRVALGYNYILRPKNVMPLKKLKLLKSPYLALLRDFNFYYLPSNLSFRTDLSRNYSEVKARNLDNPNLKIDSTVYKDFIWNRYYDMKFDLSRSLKFDFSATNIARIDEPEGAVWRENKDQYQLWKDSVLQNIRSFGRTTDYHHSFNLQYTVPINKIPLLSWTSASARYSATYGWNAGPLTADTIRLGNTIENSSKIDLSMRLNLVNLYNKVAFLKRINEKNKPGGQGKTKPKEFDTIVFENTYMLIKANQQRAVIHKLNTLDVDVFVYDEANKEIKADVVISSENKVMITLQQDYQRIRVIVKGKVPKKENPLIILAKTTLRILMSIRDVAPSFTETDGTQLPGYMPGSGLFGISNFEGWDDARLPFILGVQDKAFIEEAAKQGWLTKDSRLSNPYLMAVNKSYNLRASIEPFNKLKIDVAGIYTYTQSRSVYYFYDSLLVGDYNFEQGEVITGNFTMSVITLSTFRDPINKDNHYKSKAFEKFRQNRIIISGRLAEERGKHLNSGSPDFNDIGIEDPGQIDPKTGFHYGYGETSQEVLIPAFFAAYTGRDAHKVSLNPFPPLSAMLPNWKLIYDGLSDIEFVKQYLRSINITHSYKSSYNVAAFTNNQQYDPNEFPDGLSYVQDVQQNFVPRFDVNAISINEQFSPLIGVDLNWVNSLTTRFEYRKARTVALSLSNNQVMEMQNAELVVGAGYRFNEVQLVIKSSAGPKEFKSDLNLRADLSIRDSRTVLHKLVEDVNKATAGQKNVSIKVSAEYKLGPNFNLRVFYDRMLNNPFVSGTTYKTVNTNVGFSVTFQLIQ